jgi:hypothetical protein
MVFYIFLGLLGLGVAWWAFHSPVIRALLRGRGSDPGQWGNRFDHLADQGFGNSWNDDGGGGSTRSSRITSRHTRRRSS